MESLTQRFLSATLLVMLILLFSSPNNIQAARYVFKSRPPELAPFEPVPDIGIPAAAPITGGTILASMPPEFAPPTPMLDIPMATASPFTSSSKVLLSRSPKITPPPPMRHSPIPTADVHGWSPTPCPDAL